MGRIMNADELNIAIATYSRATVQRDRIILAFFVILLTVSIVLGFLLGKNEFLAGLSLLVLLALYIIITMSRWHSKNGVICPSCCTDLAPNECLQIALDNCLVGNTQYVQCPECKELVARRE